MGTNTVENLDTTHEQGEKFQNPKQEFDEKKLTADELRRVKKRLTSIEDIAYERDRYKKEAEKELNSLVTVTDKGENIIDLKEYRELRTQLDETQSAELTKELLEKIKNLPKEKHKKKLSDLNETKELDPQAPELLNLQKEFEHLCDENKHLIGEGQLNGFKVWFAEERRKTPTIKHLKDIIKKLEGKEIKDRNGLAPRREEYSKLENLFSRWEISSPLKSEFVKQEGLSERTQFRKNAEEMENHLRKVKGTGFYSQEILKKTMQEMLTARSPLEQKKLVLMAENAAKAESQSFTHLDSKITVGKTTIRKLSTKGKDQLIDYYKNLSIAEREKNVKRWPDFIQAEADLALKLEKIYGDNKEGLALALGSFEELNYEEKERALEEHKNLKEKSENEEGLQRTLLIKAAHAKIDEAARKGVLAKTTQKKYKEWFEKLDDLNEMKKAYEKLTDETPDGEAKNLSAYRIKRERFLREVDELKTLNPEIKKEELSAWNKKYDREGWTKRKQVYKDLKKEQETIAKKQKNLRELEETAGIENPEKNSSPGKKEKAENLQLKETIKIAQTLMNDNQNADALETLIDYWRTDLENKDILFWIGVAKDRIEKFGSGKTAGETADKNIKQEIKHLAETDKKTKDTLLEQQVKTLNIEGQRQSEQRHQKKVSAKERAKDESLKRVEEGSLEADLTKDFYEQTDEETILDKEKKGEELDVIKFSDIKTSKEEVQRLKGETYHSQGKLIKKEGLVDIKLSDKTGKRLSADAAEAKHEQELESAEKALAEEALKKAKSKETDSKVFDLNTEMAARREAKRIIDEKTHKHLKAA
ncbi:MAG: hypothetical protein ABIH78_01875 [Candidatus Peregrinibacteria bacterium]